jgi:Flp pilus assembly protein TadG
MRLRLTRLARDERGTSLIEFGFLAPFLALLTLGVIDLSRGLAERFQLQQAVSGSLELVQSQPHTADPETGLVDYSFVEAQAKAAAGTDADVKMTLWLECDGEEQPAEDFAKKCDDDEDTARYLRVKIAKDFHGDFYFDTIPMSASGALRIQ